MADTEREIAVRWQGELVFAGGREGRPPVVVDGAGAAAVSPVELLLVAAAACSAADVVLILEKQRVALRALEVSVRGTRRAAEPRRYTALHFRYTIAGAGADEVKARRAVELSLEKYCSVVASLAPDIGVAYDLVLR